MWRKLALGATAVGIGVAAFAALTQRAPEAARPPITTGEEDTSGFARVMGPREFVFPDDHGPHFDYQTEWWYYTGNLRAANGDAYGYQFTIFRRGLTPGAPPVGGLTTNQVYFAHFAITDVARREHQALERFSRGAAGLAGASGNPFTVWIEDWRVESLNPDGSQVRITAEEGPLALDLILRATKPPALQGDRGFSPKSDAPGNASHYISFTRMATTGSIRLGEQAADVTGESWFDHEWSTSALGPQAVGWDWFSLQFDDGRELMYYALRREDGTLEPVSGGNLIGVDGSSTELPREAFALEVLETWTSPYSGATYPVAWRMQVPSEGLDLTIRAKLPAQENQLYFVYWEGAVSIEGTHDGQPLRGNGYVELTGYETTMNGVL